MRLPLSAIAVVSALGGLPAPVAADPSVSPPLVHIPRGVGCYWFRGNLYCSRYCYWEIDGNRFCTRRARDAVTQAPPLGGVFYGPDGRWRPVK